MQLKPQDIVVALKLVALGGEAWTYQRLSLDLGMSPSEVHAAAKRLVRAQLAHDWDSVAPNVSSLDEFLSRGIRFTFIPDVGGPTRGLPTAHAAPPLASHFKSGDELPPVWPDPDGTHRGNSFEPLYRSVPYAARQDSRLYELLALVDAIRGGRARERALAVNELKKRLDAYGKSQQSQHSNP